MDGQRRVDLMADEAHFAKQRKAMLADQIVARGIRDPLLLDALLEVPRHLFVPREYLDMA